MRAIPTPPRSSRTERSARKVTSVNVARRADVSQSTVSLVFSGKAPGRVSEATADAVQVAARELGYRPNAAARALRSGTSVGRRSRRLRRHAPVLRPHPARRPARGVPGRPRHRADRRRLRQRMGRQHVELLQQGAVDGFVFFAADPPASLRRPGAPPIVLVETERPRLPSVRLDVEAGADALFGHLVELGHRRIAYVQSAVEGQTFTRRHGRGAHQLSELGEDPADQVVVSSRFTAEAAIAAGNELLDQLARCTAVICDDDFLASGVIAAAAQRGIAVPGQLSVCGFDDVALSPLATPPITTIRFDAGDLSAAACEMLLARLQSPAPPTASYPASC